MWSPPPYYSLTHPKLFEERGGVGDRMTEIAFSRDDLKQPQDWYDMLRFRRGASGQTRAPHLVFRAMEARGWRRHLCWLPTSRPRLFPSSCRHLPDTTSPPASPPKNKKRCSVSLCACVSSGQGEPQDDDEPFERQEPQHSVRGVPRLQGGLLIPPSSSLLVFRLRAVRPMPVAPTLVLLRLNYTLSRWIRVTHRPPKYF